MFQWRRLRSSDIASVSAIAAKVHPDFFEDDVVFAERQNLAPEGCWLCEGENGPLGYVLSHPWTLTAPPALNSLLGAIPEAPDTFYIHDLALLPEARGLGAAGAAVEILIGVAKSLPTMSLVAVNGSVPFWSRYGFAISNRPDLMQKLLSYDDAAQFMVRQRT